MITTKIVHKNSTTIELQPVSIDSSIYSNFRCFIFSENSNREINWNYTTAETITVTTSDTIDGAGIQSNSAYWLYVCFKNERSIKVGLVKDGNKPIGYDYYTRIDFRVTTDGSDNINTFGDAILQHNDYKNGGVPAGTVSAWVSDMPPSSWLVCDGSELSRTTYASLFSAIGVKYGDGDGSTTFNLPDFRGYFLRGQDEGSGVDDDSGSRTNRGDGTTGDNVGTKQEDAFQGHRHKWGSSGHYFFGGAANGTGPASGGGFRTSVLSAQDVNHNIQDAGDGTPRVTSETRPVNVAVKWIIKAF